MKTDRKLVINFGPFLMACRAIMNFLRKPLFIILTAAIAVWIIAKVDKHYLTSLHVNYPLVLKYIDVLKWPVLITGILIAFRSHLPNVLNRINELTAGSFKASLTPNNQTLTEPPEPTEEDIEAATESEPTVDAVNTRKLAEQLVWKSYYDYERAYRLIFGSQLELLFNLEAFDKGINIKDAEPFFAKHRQRSPKGHDSLIKFISYLTRTGFVSYDSSTETLSITDKGKAFLDYLREQNLSYTFKAG